MLDALHFELQVVLKLLLDIGADADDIVAGDFRHPFEEQDAVDEHLGMLHFAHRLFVMLPGQLHVAPVLAHLGLAEVLVDCRQLDRQRPIERVDYLRIALHRSPQKYRYWIAKKSPGWFTTS